MGGANLGGVTSLESFPVPAMSFYRDLKEDNSREWWLANKARYERDVRDPFRAVAALLADEFGETKLFRPNRDVRFSADKSPYKTHQGLFVQVAPACGFYCEVNSTETIAVGGFYEARSEALARVRAGMADDESGPVLEALLSELTGAGWLNSSEQLRTAPRGYTRDHPRIELLRFKTLGVEREIVAEGVDEFAAEVAQAWRSVAALIDWFAVRLRD